MGVIFLVVLSSVTSFAQNKYNFNFEQNWEWVDLMLSEQCQMFGVLEQVKYLRDEQNINDGRRLFRELAKLDSLNQLRLLPKIIETDLAVNRNLFTKLITPVAETIDYSDNFGGIIRAAVKLTELRNSFQEENKLFESRDYLVKTTEQIPSDMRLNFISRDAEFVLNNLSKSLTEDDYFGFYGSDEVTAYLALLKNGCVTKEEFINCFRQVQKNDPLTNVYICCNPLSFMSLGLVNQNYKEFSSKLSVVLTEKQNIVFSCAYLLSQFFPSNIVVNRDVNLTYGTRVCGWKGNNKEIILDLSRFGDNYELLTRYLTRELFSDVKHGAQLDVIKYLYSNEDTLLIKLVEEVYDNGISNYLAPILQANRPSALLEKDFSLFRKTYKSIAENRPHAFIDSLFNIGTAEMYYHSMGTQMTYCIDVYLGRTSVRNSLLFGPLYFFKQYIDTYGNNDSKIRKVFHLTKDFEEKINIMNKSISYDMLRDMVEIKLTKEDTVNINPNVRNVLKKYKDRKDLWFLQLLIGKLYFDKDFYAESLPYFMSSLPGIISKEKFAKEIGNEYLNKAAFKESVEMFDKYIAFSFGSLDSYLKRGLAYYNLGELEKAKADFEKVISLDPENNLAKDYLNK
ncbi:MAG: tetratricopeptide repeat protein [Ignavibacteria bacterium]